MSQEEEPNIRLNDIRINLREGYIQTDAEDGTVVRYSFKPQEVMFQLLQRGNLEGAATRLLASTGEVPEASSTDQAAETTTPEATTQKEKPPAIVLPGKLQKKPVDGRPDRHQKPTAWAPFLAHMEGHEDAVLLSASFHNHTRAIALGLSADDPITAQGYLHPAAAGSGRLSTFSVINLMRYPGKPPKKTSADS